MGKLLDFINLANVKLDFARAGKIDGTLPPLPNEKNIKIPKFIDIEKHFVTTSGFLAGVVVGTSAVPVGLDDGDFYLAKIVDKDEIKRGDIVLIKITEQYDDYNGVSVVPEDIGRLKVRVVMEVDKNRSELKTVTFSDGELKHSRAHKISDIAGKVEYRIPKKDDFYRRHIKPALN